MAKNKDIDVSSNVDDFGDFDFNVDESGVAENKVAKPSKMKSDYIPAMTSGFLSGLKRELSSKFPETASFMGELDSAFDQVKSMTTEFFSEATPMARALGKSTNRLMPLVKPFMPKGAYNWVTGKLSAIPDEEGEMSEEERMGQQISADINAALQGADASANVRSNMDQIVTGMRHKATMGGLANLGKQMHVVSSFLTGTMTAYMKKDLELQYRQLYAQRDIASTLRATAKLIEVELKHITHNTGLPESVKAEAVKKRGKFIQTARGYASKQLSTFMKILKEQAFDQVKEALSMVADAAGGAADVVEMSQDMGEEITLKNLLVKGGFSFLGKMAGTKAAEKMAPWLKSMAGGVEGFSRFGMDKLFGSLRDMAEAGKLGPFSDLIANSIPGRYKPELKISNEEANNPNKPVAFDISTRDAIVNVIPGWLSKINKVCLDLQDPHNLDKHKELIYDPKTRSFVDPEDMGSEVRKEVNKSLDDLTGANYNHGTMIAELLASARQRGLSENVTTIDAKGNKTTEKRVMNYDRLKERFFNDNMKKKLYLMSLNIARDLDKKFCPDKIYKGTVMLAGATGEDIAYAEAALRGIDDQVHFAEDLCELLGGTDKDHWNGDAVMYVENEIRQLALDNGDLAKWQNVLEDTFANGTEAKKRALRNELKTMGKEYNLGSFFDENTGKIDENVLKKYMASRMSGQAMGYAYQNKIRERMQEHLAKANPTATMADAKAQYADVFDSLDKEAQAASYITEYNKNTLDVMYGEDFVKVFMIKDEKLFDAYKHRLDVFAFDTIIATNNPSMPEIHRNAAEVFRLWYDIGSKAKNNEEYQGVCQKVFQVCPTNSIYARIARDVFNHYSDAKACKALLEGDGTENFPKLDARLLIIKNNKATQAMYSKSMEAMLKSNMHGKTGIKGWDSIISKDNAKVTGSVIGTVIGVVNPYAKAAWDWLAEKTGKAAGWISNKRDEAKEKGLGQTIADTTIGGVRLGDVGSAIKGVATGSDEEIAKMEWKDPSPEERESMIQKYIQDNNLKGKKARKKAEKAVDDQIKKTKAAFEKRKQAALKSIELRNKATSTWKAGLSTVTGQFKTTGESKYVAPTDKERDARIAAYRMEHLDDEVTQEDAAKAVDEQIAKEKADFETQEANKKPTIMDRFNAAKESMKNAFKSTADDLNGSTADEIALAENVAKIYALLEKKFGSLTEEEIKNVETKMDESREQAQQKKVKRGGLLKGIGAALGGLASGLNPFKSSPAAIAAKYQLDASAVESAFHGDFQKYFEYRKEMDVAMCAKMGKGGFFGNTFRGIGSAIGGVARGLGSAAVGMGHAVRGMVPAAGHVIAGGIRAGGSIIGGGLRGMVPAAGHVIAGGIRAGGSIIGGGLRGMGSAIGGIIPTMWDAQKTFGRGVMALGRGVRKIVTFGLYDKAKNKEKFYDLYLASKIGKKKGWEADPLLSARRQREGIYDAITHGKILKTDDITGPVDDEDGKPLITQGEWNEGIVNIEGKPISTKAKEHEKEGSLLNIHGGSLLGGLFKGIGSLIGGTAQGVGPVLAKMLGVEWDAAKGIGGLLLGGVKGIFTGIGNMLGIGNSEKAQKKKYSVILGKFDELIKAVHDMKPKRTAGDADGDGDRDNSVADQEQRAEEEAEKKERRSFRAMFASLFKKDKNKDKAKGDSNEPWWKKLMTFLADPKGALLGGLSILKTGVIDLAKIVLGISKFTLWTLPKTLLWTIPKWLITVGFPTTWAAMGKGFDWIKGNIGKTLTVAGTALALYGGYRMLKNYKDENGNVTHESLESIRGDTELKNDGMAMYRAGKVVTVAENSRKSAAAARRLAQAEKDLKAAQEVARHARRGKKARQAKEAVRSASRVLKEAQTAAQEAKQVQVASRQATSLPKVADSAADAAGILKKCKLDKLLSYCTGKWAQLKDVCKGFIDGIKKCKTLTAIGAWIKNFFKSAKAASKIGVWVKYLRFFSFLKPLVKVVMAAINYILEPAMMALDGWIRSEVMKAAAETMDSSLIDEYEEQNKFGWSRAISAVSTLGLSEVYNLSASAVSEMAAVSIDFTNAETRAADLNMQDTIAAKKKRDALKDDQLKKNATSMDRMIASMDADVSDEEVHTSSWWKPGGHIGEAWANRELRETRKNTRKAENRKQVANFFANLEKNKFLDIKGFKNDLVRLLKIAYEEQGALNNHPWGKAIANCICDIAAMWRDPKVLIDKLTFASALVNGKKKPSNVRDEALQYVWGQCKVMLHEVIAHINSLVEQEAKEAAAPKPQPTAPKPSIDAKAASDTAKAEKKAENEKLDSFFADANGSDSVYANAADIFVEHADKAWPKDGVYEAQDAVFVVCTVKGDDDEGIRTRLKYEGTCMLRTRAMLQDRYPDLPNDFGLASRRVLVNHYEPSYNKAPAERYVYVTVYKKSEVYSLFQKKTTPAETKAPTATPPAPAKQADTEAKKAEVKLEAQKNDMVVAKPGDIVADTESDQIVANVLLPRKGETISEYLKRLEAVNNSSGAKKLGMHVKSYLDKDSKAAVLAVRQLSASMGNRPAGSAVEGAPEEKSEEDQLKAAREEAAAKATATPEPAPVVTPESTPKEPEKPAETVPAPATPGKVAIHEEKKATGAIRYGYLMPEEGESEEAYNQRLELLNSSVKDWNESVDKARKRNKRRGYLLSKRQMIKSIYAPGALEAYNGIAESLGGKKITLPNAATTEAKPAPAVVPTVKPAAAPAVVPNDTTTTKPPVTAADTLATTTTADKATEMLQRRVDFLESLLKGNNQMTELLTRIADGTDKNNELTAANGEASTTQAKTWEEQYAKLMAAQAAQSKQTSMIMQANNFGGAPQKPTVLTLNRPIQLNQGVPQGGA